MLGLTLADDPAALCGDIIGRPVSPEPESEALFARIQGWLSECLLRHPECARDLEFSPPIGCLESPVALPTRVIDVGPIDSTPQPRLFESQGAQGVYIALSHCWGKLRILTTTTENYRRHQAGVEFFALSKTFRDAINITRRLGVRYLWIDSLCIIQDSRADWQTESSRMGSVYKNATLTIAAADAKDGSEGCFFPRQEPEIPAVQLLCRSTQGMYRMSVGLARGTFEGTASRSVLSTRGWVLQEKVLSRRILYFGREQVHFECQHHSVSEDGHCSPYHNSLKRSFDLRRYPGRENRNLKPPEWASNLHLFTRWGNLVREYSRRTLTQSTDKLVAISGLANEIGIRSGARYMVGLWMEGLHVGLGWRAVSENTLRKRAPPECNEPSWSWASVDGVIGYSTAKPFEIITSALRDVTYEAHRTGELELTGRCKSALYTAEYDDTEGRHLLGWEAYVSRVICGDKGAWAGKRLGIGLLDVGTHQETPITCLLIYTEKKYRRPLDSTRHGVIFLERTAEPMVFRRIGAGTLDAAEWFDDCPEQAITLI